ncbi:MAG: hypothetical protein ACFFCI_05485 [Promethearchaeota archaeon]
MTASSRRFSRYRGLLIVFILYCVFWILLVTILREWFKITNPITLSRFIPLDDALTELAFIFAIILPISSVIGVLIGGYCITPMILFFHKKILGRKMHYGVQNDSDFEKPKLFSRAFFPVLLAINLSSMFLTPTVITFILGSDLVNEIGNVSRVPVLTRFLAEIMLLTIMFGTAALLFSPVWFLKDSGIIYSNKEKLVESDETFVLKSIGDWFQTMLRSYAGIGAIITYIVIIYGFLADFSNNLADKNNIVNILSLILWLGLPFYLAISLIPSLILNDLLKNHRIKYMRKIGTRIGIKDPVAITFEFKKTEK